MADVVRPASPSPSISLLEIKAETRLVLKSFLRHSLAIAPGERPGRIGGEYNDPNKYSASSKDKLKKNANGWDSLDEEISAAEEKKHGIKDLIKRRLRPRSSTLRFKKSGSAEPTPNNTLEKQSSSDQPDKPSVNGVHSLHRKKEEEKFVPSSASEEEGDKKSGDKNKKKKKKLKISDILKKVSFKKEEPRPQRPVTLPINTDDPQREECPVSPSHPPEFYDGVAETLDRIAQKHGVQKKSPVKPKPLPSAPKENDKEDVIQQLVQILTLEGDIINEKINANPFLRFSLSRLSYPSFAKLLDTYASQSEEPPVPPPVSPTLRRLAVTMDVSRRFVTATGVQFLTGYTERYIENFAPWIRSHGGWENIAQLDDSEIDQSHLEYD